METQPISGQMSSVQISSSSDGGVDATSGTENSGLTSTMKDLLERNGSVTTNSSVSPSLMENKAVPKRQTASVAPFSCSANAANPNNVDNYITEKIHVPYFLVDQVLGRNNELIGKLKEDSGLLEMSLIPSDGNSDHQLFRYISVTGSREAKLKAYDLVSDIMAASLPKNSD